MVDVPELPFLMIDGAGDPNSDGYRAAVEALYGAAYGIRFALKNSGILEYPVMPSQGLWWTAEPHGYTQDGDRADWRWTMMIMQPPQVTPELVADTIAAVASKKPGLPVEGVRLANHAEGRCSQILHVGPFRTEPATIDRLHAFIADNAMVIAGRHHEIYLSNPNRTAPEKMRTIIRYPVRPTR
ncbi:hypothetical protein F0L68_18105 [Solihabitans fulvus]|uniref:GyrI-like small molecule binding domain-containing protein n=2 Tax=Solihabitans fulvus TaxID=1892852 RepID=A0A5B2XDA7_9PSEU|nr:hypothetical protein F0L68_18105 [Solihabitans fulvus]